MSTQLIRNCSVALLAAVSMYAQGSQKMKVQVPFGFHVGNSLLPSGEYTVDADAGPGVVRLKSGDAKASVMIIALPVQAPATPGQGKLVFHKYGEEYFLSQIWKQGDLMGRELRTTRREIEVASGARRRVESIMARK